MIVECFDPLKFPNRGRHADVRRAAQMMAASISRMEYVIRVFDVPVTCWTAPGTYRTDNRTSWLKIRNHHYTQWDARRELFEGGRDNRQ